MSAIILANTDPSVISYTIQAIVGVLITLGAIIGMIIGIIVLIIHLTRNNQPSVPVKFPQQFNNQTGNYQQQNNNQDYTNHNQ